MANNLLAKDRRALLLFGSASLATLTAGALAIFASGNGTKQPMMNLAAWLAGALLAYGLVRFGRAVQIHRTIIVLSLIALIATFAGNGLDGVDRWVSLGPVNANVAAVLLPAVIIALTSGGLRQREALGLWLAFLLLLVAQPDASQATGLACAGCAAAWRWDKPWRAISIILFLGLGAFAWFRPDPLEPVTTVEGIVGLSWDVSPLLAVAVVVAMAATLASFLKFANTDSNRTAAYVLCAYATAVSLSAAIGNFPVPLAGYGISFPIGWWLAVGLLLSKRD